MKKIVVSGIIGACVLLWFTIWTKKMTWVEANIKQSITEILLFILKVIIRDFLIFRILAGNDFRGSTSVELRTLLTRESEVNVAVLAQNHHEIHE